MSHNRSTKPLRASEGDLTSVTQGNQHYAQGTTNFDEAIARQTHPTPTDIYEEVATTYKYKPLQERGFVSPPTTTTATQEQRTQVATGSCAGNMSNHRRFPGHRSRPPHQRGLGHGTHQRQAMQCSEHDARNNMVNDDRPASTASQR